MQPACSGEGTAGSSSGWGWRRRNPVVGGGQRPRWPLTKVGRQVEKGDSRRRWAIRGGGEGGRQFPRHCVPVVAARVGHWRGRRGMSEGVAQFEGRRGVRARTGTLLSHLVVAMSCKFHQFLLLSETEARETKLLKSSNFALRPAPASLRQILELDHSAQLRTWSRRS